MQMSKVMKCDVEDCAYNTEHGCHTPAITIGDEANPHCDTFCKSGMHGGEASCQASVGACKVSCCTYNSELECQSPSISVGYQGQEPSCTTYKAR